MQSIKRDYEELRARTSSEFAVVVGQAPDGLSSFLRQLALIEREMRIDLAAVLTPEELEDWDYAETPAGHIVHELLDQTTVPEDQKRAVFRLQRDYEDRFALSFDSTPIALLEREQARQQTQAKIRDVLGDEAFGLWLSGEGAAFPQLQSFVATHNLPAPSAFELWDATRDYDLARLEVLARPGITMAESRAVDADLLHQTSARITAIVGSHAKESAGSHATQWLIHP